ncbi:uncharacterized protein LOC130827012 [Amaranthus tricolor]|uniref:uncharacterized protein LOC130826961 n=1 Tax=Amaranthus tricolor TaxID=29722 RepID=UPI0025885E98|nr:uncharacterized protein LOC130826961 [Amaranthus tricolor]XP_057548585.1 uncharacterized protein LOC130826961 [Amaranthus tricolor]XP_057548586.1 uncharacterized protein LOC130826963 [Amaranthus tricolor]XP_057548587.1 uncharacterized protein LOC130826963 [Amaranthus tricolor]XP_057548627.1 uncharacterized protein LOC130827012 [Amaranthus tricolor]XP_057548628.1 uncharacterized protein LOC130827012 [Amaranthus tricolor]
MIICTWNIRGGNDPIKIRELKKFMIRKKISFMGVLETRVKAQQFEKITKQLNSKWIWKHNYSCSPKGGIWIGWNPQIIEVEVLEVHEQLIHCELKDVNSFFFQITLCYGLHTIDHRVGLWEKIRSLASYSQLDQWFILGDFNAVMYTDDRTNGTAVSLAEIKDMSQWVTDLNLAELKSTGPSFSWSSRGYADRRIHSRIDRAFGNVTWMLNKGHIVVDYLMPSLSDHSPLLLKYADDPLTVGKPFKFFNYMAHHADFHTIMHEFWHPSGSHNLLGAIWANLTLLKGKMKSLHKNEFHNLNEKIETARSNLEQIKFQLQQDPDSVQLQENEKIAGELLRKWNFIEESALKQKSRIQWLKLGDSNNHFFHAAMKARYNTNRINLLYNAQGDRLEDPVGIQQEILHFYKSLLGSRASSLPSIDLPVMLLGEGLF